LVIRFAINYFIFFATIATVAPYLQQILKIQGFRATEIGLLLGIYELTGVLGPLLIGWFADKIGKYRIILLFLAAGSGFSFLFFIFNINFTSAVFILISFGIMYRPIVSITDALASRTLPFANRQYGSVRIWGSIGFVGLSFFYQFWGFLDSDSPIHIITVFLVLMALLFMSNLSLPVISTSHETDFDSGYSSESKVKRNIIKTIRSMPLPFWIGIVAAFIVRMGMAGYYSFFTIYLKDVYHLKSISGSWGIGALAEIPVILWGGRFVIRYGASKMLVFAALGTVIRMSIYAIEPSFFIVLIGQLFHALSFGLLHITIIVLINNQIEERSRALAMAIFGGISYGLAGFLGSSLCGYVLEDYGFSVMFFLCAVIALGAVILIIPFRKAFVRNI